jgi:hypothetical protein
MKRLFVPLLAIALVASLLGACTEPQPPPKPKPHKGKGFYTPTPAPVSPDGGTAEESTPPVKKNSGEDPNANAKPTNPVPEPPPETGNLPYAKAVPGKPGFVFSPYDGKGGYIDVRGFPPGTEVKDPYSGKSFLVP